VEYGNVMPNVIIENWVPADMLLSYKRLNFQMRNVTFSEKYSFVTFTRLKALKGPPLLCYYAFIEGNIATQELPKRLQNVAF
jgi:hypothetical protein